MKCKSILGVLVTVPLKGLLHAWVKILSKLGFSSVTGAFDAVCPALPPGARGATEPLPSAKLRLGPWAASAQGLWSTLTPKISNLSHSGSPEPFYLASSCNFALISLHWEVVFRKTKKKKGEGGRGRKYTEVLLNNFL